MRYFSENGVKIGYQHNTIKGFMGRCAVQQIPHVLMMSSFHSPTGVSGSQSPAQRWGGAGCGAAADIVRAHFGCERNLQRGGGRNAQHPLRVSPGTHDIGWKKHCLNFILVSYYVSSWCISFNQWNVRMNCISQRGAFSVIILVAMEKVLQHQS